MESGIDNGWMDVLLWLQLMILFIILIDHLIVWSTKQLEKAKKGVKTIIDDKKRDHILTFKNLEPSDVWHISF